MTAVFTATGIPDGDYLVTVITDDVNATLVASEVSTFASGTTTIVTALTPGTQVYGLVRDNSDPSAASAPLKSITI